MYKYASEDWIMEQVEHDYHHKKMLEKLELEYYKPMLDKEELEYYNNSIRPLLAGQTDLDKVNEI
jgi:hypothetical protein